jgi:hypothetical protein
MSFLIALVIADCRASGKSGIHDHHPSRIYTANDHEIRARREACHRAGHFGPGPLARPGMTDEA